MNGKIDNETIQWEKNMGNSKGFMKNFGLSLLMYLVIILLGGIAIVLMSIITWDDDITAMPRNVIWAEILLWLSTLTNIALCFFLGTKLKLLGSPWLNFLSVSGIFGLWLIIITASISFEWIRYLLYPFVQMPFLNLVLLIGRIITNLHIVTTIAAIIPSIMMWFGMLYQTKKIRRTITEIAAK